MMQLNSSIPIVSAKQLSLISFLCILRKKEKRKKAKDIAKVKTTQVHRLTKFSFRSDKIRTSWSAKYPTACTDTHLQQNHMTPYTFKIAEKSLQQNLEGNMTTSAVITL
jgi:hypothetical protein